MRGRLLLLIVVALLACKRAPGGSAPAPSDSSAPASSAASALSLADGAGKAVAAVSGATATYRGLACTVTGGGELLASCAGTRVKVKPRPDGGVKLEISGGSEVKLKLKEDGWKIEDGKDQLIAKLKRKDAGYVLEVNGSRAASAAVVGTSVEVRDASGATLFKGSAFSRHPELAALLVLPEGDFAPAQRAAMLAWAARQGG